LEIAKLYLRTADYTNKKSCGIYEIESEKGRKTYKIFAGNDELVVYLKKNKGKRCKKMVPEFAVKEYVEYPNTQVRKLTESEIERYMREKLK